MVLPRASGLSGALGRTVLRRAGAQARTRASRQIGRRTYASGHGEQQSSEIPWIIGSIVVTVPAASWLWSQGPKKSDHGHGDEAHGEEHEEHEEEEEKSEEGGEEEASGDDEPKEEESKEEEPKEEESKEEESSDDKPSDEAKDETKDEGEEKEDSKEETKDEGSDEKEAPKEEDESGDKPSPDAPGQINYSPDSKKGPGEGQKAGDRRPTERHRDVMAANDHSGAKHPYLDDPEKSKKGAGPTETAKIHGTVDTSKPTRGPKD